MNVHGFSRHEICLGYSFWGKTRGRGINEERNIDVKSVDDFCTLPRSVSTETIYGWASQIDKA